VRIAVLNGVNLDVLGKRDASIYGGITLSELETSIYQWGRELEQQVTCRQTNSEGEYIEWIHDAYGWADGVVVNPAAWSHYSWAVHDALEPLAVPIVEVHLSNVEQREEWRRFSVIAELATKRIIGRGPQGYRDALEFFAEGA
jgi:3-dehydroquinate dehydratase-2